MLVCSPDDRICWPGRLSILYPTSGCEVNVNIRYAPDGTIRPKQSILCVAGTLIRVVLPVKSEIQLCIYIYMIHIGTKSGRGLMHSVYLSRSLPHLEFYMQPCSKHFHCDPHKYTRFSKLVGVPGDNTIVLFTTKYTKIVITDSLYHDKKKNHRLLLTTCTMTKKNHCWIVICSLKYP